MKPGDKVWMFLPHAQHIIEVEAHSIKVIGEETQVEIQYKNGARSSGYLLGRDVFPTREALCEHYRKIFE